MLKLFYCAAVLVLGLTKMCSTGNPATSSENKPRPGWLQLAYSDAVLIEAENSSELDGTYLINQPVDFNPDSLAVFFVMAKLPPELFKNSDEFYPELKEFILIVPDFEFYNRLAEESSKRGITAEPATTNYYYHVKRADGQVMVDSYHISGEGHPQLKYRDPMVPKNKIVVYRTESYGSVCCPKDERRILEEHDAPFIRQYEQQHGVKIEGSYRQVNGKEGEHNNYYTLQGLDMSQQLAFLVAKNKQWQLEGKTLIPTTGLHVITPALIPLETEGIRKLQPITYTEK